MLIKASHMIGLPVFTIQDGKKVETVADVVYHPIENKIEALLTDKGGLFAPARVILFEDIRSIGENAVLIDTAAVLKKVSEVKNDIQAITKSDAYLTGKKIIAEEGDALGTVSDIYFDSKTGIVEEFEVSAGADKSHKQEKKRIKISDIITIGRDAAIVRLEQTLENSTEEKTEEPAGDLEMQNFEPVPPEPENEAFEGELPPVKIPLAKRKVNDRRKKDAVGLYLTKNILTPDDKLLAKEGDMVTYKLLDQAEIADVLDQVLNNIAQHVSLMA